MMEDDQQFCLRWNNHQSTLISVFDTLLENEKLVDCTLAAEGRIMKAHKVVLSACSPYFATLLQEQYDKHPIFILKDVKFQELRAMMDYMYRGEVNISQDQLAALLKAAESLQIKGLSDNRTGAAPRAEQPQQQQQMPQQHHRGLSVPGVSKLSGGYTLEAQTKRSRIGAGPMDTQDMSVSREGSSSPSRRRRKVRRRSHENAMAEPHDNSNSSQQQASLLQSNASLAGVSAITAAASALASQLPTVGSVSAATGATIATTQQAIAASVQQQQQQQGQQMTTTSVTKKTENVKGTSDAMNTENIQVTAGGAGGAVIATGGGIVDAEAMEQQQQQQHAKTDKQNHKQKQTGSIGGGKEGTELVIEPKSEYDEEGNDETCEDLTLDDEDMGMDDLDQNAGTSQGGEGSSQGYAAWQHDRSQDELLLSTQEAQQRDPQDDLKYDFKATMLIGNENSLNQRFPCVVCGKSYLRKRHLQRHMRDECIGIPPRFSCDLCPSRFRRKYHMVRHLTSKHNIPAAIAQQTTGNSTRNGNGNGNGNGSAGINNSNNNNNNINNNGGIGSTIGSNGNTSGCENGSIGSNGSHHGCDSPIPENLSVRRMDYNIIKHENVLSPLSNGGGGGGGGNGIGGGYTCGGNIGIMRASPVPGTAAVGGGGATNTLPTYGLTGAITAISAAAAVIEEQAAAAAAAAAAASKQKLALHKNDMMIDAVCDHHRDDDDGDDAATTNADKEVAAVNIKKEPVTPSKTAAGAAAAAANMLDEDWKMKLSLQFISNSLLKERLMNTMPFAYNNN